MAYSVIELEIHFWIKALTGIILCLFALSLMNSSSSYMVENSPHFTLKEIKRVSKRRWLKKENKNEFFGIYECDLVFHNTDFLIKLYKKTLDQNLEFISEIDEKSFDRQKLYDLEYRLKYFIELLEQVKKIKK